MRDIAARIRALGAGLSLIGNGTPEQAEAFRSTFAGELSLLVDPQLVGYQAMQLRRSVLGAVASSFRVSAIRTFLRLRRQGVNGGPTEGDPWQLGGLFVIVPGGDVRLSFVSRAVSDDLPLGEVLDVLSRLRPSAATP